MRSTSARSRLHRDPILAPLVLQPRDLTVLRDLFYLRWAATPALFLTASWANGGKGLAHFAKRLTHLWRAGYASRFLPSHGRYLHGSRHFIYTLESGKAAAASRTGKRPAELSEAEWRGVLAEAAPVRDRTRDALLMAGIAPAELDRVLHNNTELALKYYTGEISGIAHRVLASEILSALWFSARMNGLSVEDIQPDGIGGLSFREPEPRRFRELVVNDGLVPIKPDSMFTIGAQRIVLEAETGTASIAKVRLKLRRYARLFAHPNGAPAPPARLIVHCRTTAHAELVTAVCRDVLRPVPPTSIIITTGDDVHRLACDPSRACMPAFWAPLTGTLVPLLPPS